MTSLKRRRNAAATREAILQSALIAFSQAGYDGVGLREIAQEAGVTAILINRYFGSKEELFAAAVEVAFADNRLFSGNPATLSDQVAQVIVAKAGKEVEPVDPLLLMLRSASNTRAAEILRESIRNHFEIPLRGMLSGQDIHARAVLFLAVIAGYQLMRSLIASTALVEVDEARISDHLASLFRVLIDVSPQLPVRKL